MPDLHPPENDTMIELANNLAAYTAKTQLAPALSRAVGFFMATVTGRTNDGKLTVRVPFDDTQITLPCAASAAALPAGTKVLCLTLGVGNRSQALVLCDAALTTL